MGAANIERSGQMIFWTDIPTVLKGNETVTACNIPSDNNSGFDLSLHANAAYGDVFVTMCTVPGKKFVYLPGVRLRGGLGGGLNPFITEGFGKILSYFNNGMMERPDMDINEPAERLNSNSPIIVKRNQGEARLSITGIQDDDRTPNFIDIKVLKSGDVKLKLRFSGKPPFSKPPENIGEMLFKTREHGGRHPYIAATLTQLAEKIAAAKKPW